MPKRFPEWVNTEVVIKAIKMREEDNVKTALNVRENPFKLIYEGELDKQR